MGIERSLAFTSPLPRSHVWISQNVISSWLTPIPHTDGIKRFIFIFCLCELSSYFTHALNVSSPQALLFGPSLSSAPLAHPSREPSPSLVSFSWSRLPRLTPIYIQLFVGFLHLEVPQYLKFNMSPDGLTISSPSEVFCDPLYIPRSLEMEYFLFGTSIIDCVSLSYSM